jgi:hypothetical protein
VSGGASFLGGSAATTGKRPIAKTISVATAIAEALNKFKRACCIAIALEDDAPQFSLFHQWPLLATYNGRQKSAMPSKDVIFDV